MAHILIIEDNDDIAELWRGILGQAGHSSERAAAAYGAAIRMTRGQFDLVLMDLLLQGANGAVTGLALRGLGYAGPIVIITGGLMPIEKDVYERVGFAGKLLKPVGPKELTDEVNRQLRNEQEGSADVLLYAVARARNGVEYYVPRERGYVIGWTEDRSEAWCIERSDWAERVRKELERHGIYQTWVHVFEENLDG